MLSPRRFAVARILMLVYCISIASLLCGQSRAADDAHAILDTVEGFGAGIWATQVPAADCATCPSYVRGLNGDVFYLVTKKTDYSNSDMSVTMADKCGTLRYGVEEAPKPVWIIFDPNVFPMETLEQDIDDVTIQLIDPPVGSESHTVQLLVESDTRGYPKTSFSSRSEHPR